MADAKFIIDIFARGARKAASDIAGVDNGIGKLAKTAATYAASIFAAGGLISAMQESIKLAQEQARVERRLQQAVGGSIDYWKRYASSLQSVTNFGDEVILGQLGILKSLGLTSKQMRETLKAATDLAAGTDMTLDSAVRNLAKTYSGLAGELGELIPELRTMTAEQLKHGEAIDVIAEKYRGMAEAAADGITQQKNAWGDFMEVMGGPLGEWWEGVGANFLEWAKAFEVVVNFATGNKGVPWVEQVTVDALQRIKEKQEEVAQAAANAFVGPLIDPAELARRQNSQRIQGLGLGASTPEDFAAIHDAAVEEAGIRIAAQQREADERYRIRDEQYALEMEMFDAEVAAFAAKEEQIIRQIKMREAIQKESNLRTVSSLVGSLGMLNQALAGNAAFTKRLAQTQAIIDTYAGMNKALAQGGIFGFIGAAAIFAQGMANVEQIEAQRFAKGGSFETSGPQLIMVGDNSGGRERVDITPLSSPNINGPQQGGMVININAAYVDEDAVRDHLVPLVERKLIGGRA